MKKNTLYCAGSTKAVRYAAGFLQEAGWQLLPNMDIPADYILLDVPSFRPDGALRSGGSLRSLLERVSPGATVIGGNLNPSSLPGHRIIDLLRNEGYLAENAAITAECALDAALPYLTVTLRNCPVLILGWGRIGKCLARLLHRLGSKVSIAARKESDLAMIGALGYSPRQINAISDLERYRLIFNTVPKIVLNRDQAAQCRPDCVKIDLASTPGIEDEDVIVARGLPGIHFPESSGRLIAETVLRMEENR